MKKIILIMLTVLLAAASAEARQRILADLDNIDDVERIYVSASMLAGMDISNITGIDKDAIKNLQGLEVISSSNRKGARELRTAFQEFVKRKKYTLLTEVEEKNEEYLKIYVREVEKNTPNKVSTVVMEQSSRSSCVLIVIDADINIEKLREGKITL